MANPPSRRASSREVRRQKLRERQFVVYGLLGSLMVVLALVALAVLDGVLPAPLARQFVSIGPSPDPVYPQPCVAADTLPVGYLQVSVEVLNSSDRAGLAATAAKDLTDRGFTVAGTGNSDSRLKLQTSRIQMGVQGVAAAYTLGAQLPRVTYYLDQREDASVTLVLGENYVGLLEPDAVDLDPETPLVSVAGCVSVEQLTPLPISGVPAVSSDASAPSEGTSGVPEGTVPADPAATDPAAADPAASPAP